MHRLESQSWIGGPQVHKAAAGPSRQQNAEISRSDVAGMRTLTYVAGRIVGRVARL